MACEFRVKLLPLYATGISPVFVLSDSPPLFLPFLCGSYANYERLVVFFLDSEIDEVFFTKVRFPLRHGVSMPTWLFQRVQRNPRPSSWCSSILGTDLIHFTTDGA